MGSRRASSTTILPESIVETGDAASQEKFRKKILILLVVLAVGVVGGAISVLSGERDEKTTLGAGTQQHDVNECEQNNGDCDQVCINEVGSFSCGCYRGYEMNSSGSCVDIDECETEDNGGCSEKCTNTDGSFSCSCYDDGYEFHQMSWACVDVNECQTGNGGCEQTCTNSPPGSCSCGCDPGFTLAEDGLSCDKGCGTTNGGCEQLCTDNAVGDASCSCNLDGYFLRQDGKSCADGVCGALATLWSPGERKISPTEGALKGGMVERLGAKDYFGCALAFIGDLDGDGVEDVAVGAHGDDDGGTNRGAVYLFLLTPEWGVKAEYKISSTHGGLVGPLKDSGHFGWAVAGLGDVNGDGVGDVAVGVPGVEEGDRGGVFVLLLNPDGTLVGEQEISAGEGGLRWGLLETYGNFGRSVAAVGDLDEDGVVDMVVGAPGRQHLYVLLLRADGVVKASVRTGTTLELHSFGKSVAGVGDINGDGVMDLVVGANVESTGALRGGGSVYVVFLNRDGSVVQGMKHITSGHGGFQGSLDTGDEFGSSVGRLGDLDGDGVPDLVVGASEDDDGATGAGAVYVLLMKRDGTVKRHQKISSTQGGVMGGKGGWDAFGGGGGAGAGVIGKMTTLVVDEGYP